MPKSSLSSSLLGHSRQTSSFLIMPKTSLLQMRQPDYGGGMRNDAYYPPPQQQPMAAQPNPYGGGADPYGQPQPQAQPAPYSYSTGAGNPDMYSRR